MRSIEDLAKRGEHHDIMDALKILIDVYMTQCGKNWERQVVCYYAADAWLKKLALVDLPLSEMARKNVLKDMMPFLNNEYDPCIFNKYGSVQKVEAMDSAELKLCCQQMIEEDYLDEAIKEVLCWGLLDYLSETSFEEIKTVAPDGTLLEGVVYIQDCGHTSLDMYISTSDDAIMVSKDELVRDVEGLLVEAYNDYHRLQKMENEARALYPKYLEEIEKVKEAPDCVKDEVFKRTYHSIVSESVIDPEEIMWLLDDWFGLKFHTSRYDDADCTDYFDAFKQLGKDAPEVLYGQGNIESLMDRRKIAVIGSRNCTEDGYKDAYDYAFTHARQGDVIVSGLAQGCDTAAHRGALDAGGYTIAIIGSGLDMCHPIENRDLMNEIIQNGGMILTEYEYGTPATPYRLTARCRLQAALADEVYVAECRQKSGTMRTVKWAEQMGKPVIINKIIDDL